MKVLLFMPKSYSLAEMLFNGFSENGWDVKIIDYKELLSKWRNRLYERTSGLPNRITKYWKPEYYKEINRQYVALVKAEKPDLVFIYNNQFVFPETLEKISKESKIAFFLGDNPLYSNTFDFNLSILKYSDYTISPDSHWTQELIAIGMPNIFTEQIGYSSKIFYKTDGIPNDLKEKYASDLLFIGSNYGSSAGYKRTMFYDSVRDYGLKIFGTNEWLKWLSYFPDLENCFTLLKSRVSNEELNYAINCTKIYPIDQNPWLINGIHVRVFETIGANALPIVEWRPDLDTFFNGHIPSVQKYSDLAKTVEYYLDHEKERVELVSFLRDYVSQKYTPTILVKKMLSWIYK